MRYLFFGVAVMIAQMLSMSDVLAMENNSVVTIASVQSTATISGIAIDTATATAITVSTSPLYRQVCVQNFDTSAYLSCSENINVSTSVSSALVGTIIAKVAIDTAPPAPICFEVVAGKHFYCKSSGAGAATRAGITRKR